MKEELLMKKKKVLLIDDDQSAMAHIIRALEEVFDLTHVSTVESAIDTYNREPFDLIILDLSIPISKETNFGPLEGGKQIYKEMQMQDIISKIPIIIFTHMNIANHKAWFIERHPDQDTIIFLTKKGVNAIDTLIDEAKKLTYRYPATENTSYYILDVVKSKEELGKFNTISTGDISDDFLSNWKFNSVFSHWFEVDSANNVLKFYVESDTAKKPQGIIFTASGLPNFPTEVLFETSPNNSHRNPQRPLKGIGKAFVAWIIQQNYIQYRQHAFSIEVGQASDFFQKLGFKPLPKSKKVYFISKQECLRILDEVHKD
jgi:CheY-like chemotaxis protein/N-acetylglutamate synthase-like GNAT family acetyltransferase